MEPEQLAEKAATLRAIYEPRYAFPEWTVHELGNGNLMKHAEMVTVYYPKGSNLQDVIRLVREREPVNIGMRRRYNKEKLKEEFGYATGAYGNSTVEKLMPNIAMYCKTPMSNDGVSFREVHVINVIGFAFDRQLQPDYQYFFSDDEGKREELVEKMRHMWEYVFFCAKEKNLKRVYLAQVGGGAFAFLLGGNFSYDSLRTESLEPVKARYPEIETLELPRIPDFKKSVAAKVSRPHPGTGTVARVRVIRIKNTSISRPHCLKSFIKDFHELVDLFLGVVECA